MNEAQRQLVFDYALKHDVSAAYAALTLELIESDDFMEVIRRRPSAEVIADIVRLGPAGIVQEMASQLPLHAIQEEVIRATTTKIGFGRLAATSILERDLPLEIEVALRVAIAFWDNDRGELGILEDAWTNLTDLSCLKVVANTLTPYSRTEKMAAKLLKIVRKLNRRSPKNEVESIIIQLAAICG